MGNKYFLNNALGQRTKHFSLLAILFVVCFFGSLSSVSAEGIIDPVKQGENITLLQICDSCTYVNLTSVYIPTGQVYIFNSAMTKSGNNYYYVFENTSNIGSYIYSVCGDKAGSLACESIGFEVTRGGFSFESKNAILYIVVLILGLALFGLSFFGFITLPFSNGKDELGNVIGINGLKYVKVILFFVSYGLLTWIVNMLVGITNNFLDLGIEYKFFEVVFRMLISLVYPLIIGGIIIMVIMAIKDFKIKKIMDGGFNA